MSFKNTFVLCLAVGLLANPAFSKNDKNKDKHQSLPPGLEKKYSKGKPLPPGWQKKLSKGDVLDNDIYIRGVVVSPLGKDGIISISVEGSIIKLIEKTHEIIHVAH